MIVSQPRSVVFARSTVIRRQELRDTPTGANRKSVSLRGPDDKACVALPLTYGRGLADVSLPIDCSWPIRLSNRLCASQIPREYHIFVGLDGFTNKKGAASPSAKIMALEQSENEAYH